MQSRQNADLTGSAMLDAYGRPKRDHVERQINEEQAAVVRRIFHLSAEGKGMISIARLLNDESRPAPRNSGNHIGRHGFLTDCRLKEF
ncbi:MAG: recombinase family protein [Nitrospiraceae bacterium]